MMSADISVLTGVRDIDRQLAAQLLRYELQANPQLSAEAQEALTLAALMVSVALGKGQVCLPLSLCLLPELRGRWQHFAEAGLGTWLSQCHTVFVTGGSGIYQRQPLVLNGSRLYLARYYFYEQGVLSHIRQRLQAPLTTDDQALSAVLDQLFGQAAGAAPDWQKIAAASACVQRFAVITGGPGTGKTTTVTRLLSALLSLNTSMTIALAAPTGKAAARMTESIRAAKQQAAQMAVPDADAGTGGLPGAERIPDESFTLHRLLGWSPRGFRYHAQHTLPYDCVVVDEASMVDLPMMYHLFSAMAPQARLILLGDRDQLASVEAGSVLADLCDAGREHHPDAAFSRRLQQLTGAALEDDSEAACSPMQNAVALLRVSHRFDANSGIGQLARAVNQSDAAAAATAFSRYNDIAFDRLPQESSRPYWQQPAWHKVISDGCRDFCQAVTQQQPAAAVFEAFNRFQVLVALRQGVYGVEQVNSRIERLLQASGLLDTRPQSGVWYAGRPVMISRNDYDLGLFNGDIGIALPVEGEPGAGLKVAFPDADGHVRWLLPGRLPAHETAFAMTVHKSQGSEFTELCLLLPDQWQSVITRELIYTAITRAKRSFHLFASESCWATGLSSKVQRASGLRDALWNNAPDNQAP